MRSHGNTCVLWGLRALGFGVLGLTTKSHRIAPGIRKSSILRQAKRQGILAVADRLAGMPRRCRFATAGEVRKDRQGLRVGAAADVAVARPPKSCSNSWR